MFLLLLMVIVLPGCSHQSYEREDAGIAGLAETSGGDENRIFSFLGSDDNTDKTEMKGSASYELAKKADADKAVINESKIIKTAHLEFQVAAIKKSKEKISTLVKTEKGYISNCEENNNRDQILVSYTIRVPAEGFDTLTENILKEASYVRSSRIERRDVTEEFIDLQARLKTKKDAEASLRELLHRAKSVEDILTVEKELGVVREEIEAKEGRIKYLTNQNEFSTIYALVYQTIPYTRPPTSEGEKFSSRLVSSLSNGWDGLVDFFIGLITIWPAWIIIGGVTYLIIRLSKRNKRLNKDTTKKNPPAPPIKKEQ